MKKFVLFLICVVIIVFFGYNLSESLNIKKKILVEVVNTFSTQLTVKDTKGRYESIIVPIAKSSVIVDVDGNEKSIEDISEGSKLEIYHSGMTDKSYVPKILNYDKIVILGDEIEN